MSARSAINVSSIESLKRTAQIAKVIQLVSQLNADESLILPVNDDALELTRRENGTEQRPNETSDLKTYQKFPDLP